MVQSNHALQTHLSEANRSNKELRSQLDKSAVKWLSLYLSSLCLLQC